jgi:prepilin-type N-terminal cleavage/methylation domain-containing protein
MPRRPRQNGLTLIEIMVVLLVIALLSGALTAGYQRLPQTALKREAVHLAATLRGAYDAAAASGATHRMTFDLDKGTYSVERCEGKVEVKRSKDLQEELDRQKEEAEKAARLADEAQNQMHIGPNQQPTSPEALLLGMTQVPGQAVGGAGGQAAAKCAPMRGELGKPYELGAHPVVKLSRVWVGHLDEPARQGKVTVHFFPLGTAEKAVIELAVDEDNAFSIQLQPISGRIDMLPGAAKRPEDFMSTDATGNRVTTP